MGDDRTVAVVPAAGKGLRMGLPENKVYLTLVDRPVLAHTLAVFEECPQVDEVVLVVADGEEDFCRREVLRPFKLEKVTGVVKGGDSRQESVRQALRYIGGAAGLVVVHDGARPLVPADLVLRAVAVGRELGAVVTGLPVKETVKRVAPARPAPLPAGAVGEPPHRVLETLNRGEVWLIQTPQVFWYDLLEMAHRRGAPAGGPATDDATLVERLRHPVYVILGSDENIKVTTPLDLVLARAILTARASAGRRAEPEGRLSVPDRQRTGAPDGGERSGIRGDRDAAGSGRS